MKDIPPENLNPSRRTVLAGALTGGTAMWLATHWSAILDAHAYAASNRTAKRPSLAFFSADQAAAITSVTAQIIPTDDSPGAREAGAVFFIDRALTTFEKEKQALYSAGLQDLERQTQQLFPDAGTFTSLASEKQLRVLQAIESTAFFEQVRVHTIISFFANPEYGGNQEKAGWKLIGFEDKFDWQPPFGYYDRNHKQG
jgi:gluconate 2-dehydrogenase gamma chain